MDVLKLFRLQWDRAIAISAGAIGLIALLLGYLGTSGTPHVAEQLPYFISGGLFGIFCLAVAGIAWISADLRDEWRELRAVRELLEEEALFRENGRPARELALEQTVAYLPGAGGEELALARNGSEKRRSRKTAAAASVEP